MSHGPDPGEALSKIKEKGTSVNNRGLAGDVISPCWRHMTNLSQQILHLLDNSHNFMYPIMMALINVIAHLFRSFYSPLLPKRKVKHKRPISLWLYAYLGRKGLIMCL